MMLKLNRLFYIVVLLLSSLLIFLRFFINIDSRLPQECASNREVHLQNITCFIEGAKRLHCLKEGDDVYLPFFKFIKKQFDVDGKLNGDNFEYHTSYAKVRVPEWTTYNPLGEFGHFGSYNVEIRDRVRCINAEYGVPMSVQWDSTPYFYPIQIAQFALQHYSRMKQDPLPPKVVRFDSQDFIVPESVKSEYLKNNGTFGLVLFNKPGSLSSTINLDSNTELVVLVFGWLPTAEKSWFSVEVEDLTTNTLIVLNYVFNEDNRCVWMESNKHPVKLCVLKGAVRNVRAEGQVSNIVLDLLVDATKAVSITQSHSKSFAPGDLRLKAINFFGSAEVKLPLKQQNRAHLEKFMQGAEWFIFHQNSVGGWSVPVQRSIADDRLILEAGWHSAMAQGHAISVLVRAYHISKRTEFLESAQRALNLFKLNATKGGIVNHLFGNPWYEEYPTTPGTFVLNGFIYSLIGLYDASIFAELKADASNLFTSGVASLKIFLPLYDAGSGSIYDLRHLGLKTAPNLARWDYHSVHVYLLKWLFTITGDKQFNDVAERWISYAYGKKAKHN